MSRLRITSYNVCYTKLLRANISKVSPTVVPMTNEPTGIAWNPSNGHFYVTDDDSHAVFDWNIGGDGVPGTSDDSYNFV